MIICDGCNVRDSWEHRCHGSNAFVQGHATGSDCECPECNEPCDECGETKLHRNHWAPFGWHDWVKPDSN